MVLVKKSITLTQPQDDWVKRQVEAGRYANESELLRDLIRREQDRSPGLEQVRRLLLEGRQSGKSERSAEEIFAHAKQKVLDGKL